MLDSSLACLCAAALPDVPQKDRNIWRGFLAHNILTVSHRSVLFVFGENILSRHVKLTCSPCHSRILNSTQRHPT